MRQSIVRIATAIYIVGLVIAFNISTLSVPPADLPIYLGLAAIALIPAMFGENRFRVFGGIIILVCIVMAGIEHFAGLKINEQMRQFHQKVDARNQETNAPPSQTP